MRNDALEEGIDRRMIDFANRLHDRDKKAEAARALIYSCDGKVRLHYNEPQKSNRIGTLKQFVYGLILVAGTYIGTTGYFQACDLRQQNADLHQQQVSARKELDKCKTVAEERENQNTGLLKQTASYKELAESRVERSVLEEASRLAAQYKTIADSRVERATFEEINSSLTETSSKLENALKQMEAYKSLAEARVERAAFEQVSSRLAETSSSLEDALKQAADYRMIAESRVERSAYEEVNARLGEVSVQLEEVSKQAAEYKAIAESRIDRTVFEQTSSKLEEVLKRAEQGEQRLKECEQQSWEYRRELRVTDDFLGKLVAEKNIDDYVDKLINETLRKTSFSSPPPWESHIDKFCEHLFGRKPCPALRAIVRKNMYKSVVCSPGKTIDETIKEWDRNKTPIEYSLK